MKLSHPSLLLFVLLALPVFAGGDGSATRKTPPEPLEQAPYHPSGESGAQSPKQEVAPGSRKSAPPPQQDARDSEFPPIGGPGSTGTYRRPAIPEDME